MTVTESLCDALLLEFGLGTSYEGSLTEARELIKPHAEAIVEHLNDNGYIIVERSNNEC
jgi:hypothetical protein